MSPTVDQDLMQSRQNQWSQRFGRAGSLAMAAYWEEGFGGPSLPWGFSGSMQMVQKCCASGSFACLCFGGVLKEVSLMDIQLC